MCCQELENPSLSIMRWVTTVYASTQEKWAFIFFIAAIYIVNMIPYKLLLVISLHLIIWRIPLLKLGKERKRKSVGNLTPLYTWSLKVCTVLYSNCYIFWWCLLSKKDSFDSQTPSIIFLQAKISIFTTCFRKLEFLYTTVLSSKEFLSAYGLTKMH